MGHILDTAAPVKTFLQLLGPCHSPMLYPCAVCRLVRCKEKNEYLKYARALLQDAPIQWGSAVIAYSPTGGEAFEVHFS